MVNLNSGTAMRAFLSRLFSLKAITTHLHVVVLAIFLLELSFQPLFGQSNDQEAAGIQRTRRLQYFGLSQRQVEALKGVGVDVQGALDKNQTKDEMTKAAFSDLVVVGQVEEAVGMPGPRDESFHSRVVLAIENVLKGEVGGIRSIEILRQSGPVDTMRVVRYSTEVDLKAGDKVILFLQRPEKNPHLYTKYNKYFEKSKVNFVKDKYWTNPSWTYFIKDNQTEIEGRKISLIDVIKNVTTIARLLRDNK